MNTDKTQTWMTVIGMIVAAAMPLLVAYGLLTAEKSALWTDLILAIAAAVVPVVVGSLIKNFNDNRTFAATSALEMETARLTLERALLEKK